MLRVLAAYAPRRPCDHTDGDDLQEGWQGEPSCTAVYNMSEAVWFGQ